MPSTAGKRGQLIKSIATSRATSPAGAGATPSVDLAGFHEGQGFTPEPSADLTSQDSHDPYDYIQEFFRSKPETLRKHADHTTSTSTREPAFFDRHLDPLLQLAKVVHLPSITADLMKMADDAVEAARLGGTLPTKRKGFPLPAHRLNALRASPVNKIICEEQIVSIYKLNTSEFCATVAATLEFQLPTWSNGHLTYTLERDKARGIADGFLKLDDTTITGMQPLSATHALVADKFPTIALWEFKSLTAGSVDVMEAIVQQPKAFSWHRCELGKACVSDAKHREKNGSPKITGHKMGYDALAESLAVPVADNPTTMMLNVSSPTLGESPVISIVDNRTTMMSDSPSPPLEPPVASIIDSPATKTPDGPPPSLSNKARISAARITQQVSVPVIILTSNSLILHH